MGRKGPDKTKTPALAVTLKHQYKSLALVTGLWNCAKKPPQSTLFTRVSGCALPC